MNPNKVYDKISIDKYRNIKQLFTKKYNIYQKEPSLDYIEDLFEIRTKEGKITFTYYKKNKIMIHSSPHNEDFINIVKEIDDILSVKSEKQQKQNTTDSSLEEDKTDFDCYIGCDEAGRGETFGSLFLGCALIKKENINKVNDVLGNKNIRKLNKNTVLFEESITSANVDFFFFIFIIIIAGVIAWRLTHTRTKERCYFSLEIKRQILKNQNYKCAIRKRNTEVWDYDHKNGDRSNNKITNCQALCPNCHALANILIFLLVV